VVDAPLPADGEDLDAGAFIDAIAGGRVVVSTGPLVDLEVAGAGPGSTVEGRGLRATVRVRASGWVPVPEVRLVVDGDVVVREPLGKRADGTVLDRTYTWDVPLDADGWVLAEAGISERGDPPGRVPGRYGLAAPGYAPIGFTNPVWVDVDGDGWVPPGL